MNRRRGLLLALAAGLAAPLRASAILAWPPLLLAQAPKRLRVGWLYSATQADAVPSVEAFLAGMRERGYAPGEGFVLDLRFADGDNRRFPALAAELIALKPDVLVAVEAPARAMVALTASIPIVLVTSADPVAAGLVKSLGRPGTNVTGMMDRFDQLIAKQVELLVELVPILSRFALLEDPSWSFRESGERFARIAAKARGLGVTLVSARNANDVQDAFAALEKTKPDGLIVPFTARTFALRREITEGTRRLRLPAVYGVPPYAESGGLLSYGPNVIENNNRDAADFVVRIFKGARPAELPVRQTKKYELVLNLKTAREIGITIPPSILVRADRVIE